DRHGTFLFALPDEPQYRGLEPAEREVIAIGEPGLRERERVGVSLLRDPLDDRPARKAEPEETGHLVERLTGRVVDGPAECPKTAMRFHQHQVAVRARDHEHDRGDERLGWGV